MHAQVGPGALSVFLLLPLLPLASCGSDNPGAADTGAEVADGDVSDGGFDAETGADGTTGPIPEDDYPQVVATTWCQWQFECDCNELDADEGACVERVTRELARAADYYRSLGLTYDDRCASAVLRQIAARGCTGFGHPVEVGCAFCPFYVGDQARGETCTPVAASAASTCVQGLFCLRAGSGDELTCADPCEVFGRYVGLGEACDPSAGVSCEPLEAMCGTSGTCEAFPGLGEACPRGMCSGDSYCDPASNVCLEYLRRGDVCTDGTQCETGFCDEGFCASFCWPQPF